MGHSCALETLLDDILLLERTEDWEGLALVRVHGPITPAEKAVIKDTRGEQTAPLLPLAFRRSCAD